MRPATPDFVVAGAGRAGSTAVVESLRRRPDVFVTQPKEPHFLALADIGPVFAGPGDDATINRILVRELAHYQALFREAPEHALRGEGSVSTLYYAERAAPRLQLLNPQARVIVVLRDPIARAYSSHQYLVNRGYEPVTDFFEALALEEERRAAGWHHLWHYAAMSMYADGVEHFLQAFPAGSVRVWWYDDLVTDEVGTMAQIQEFLGLERHGEVISPGRVNASGTPRRRWLHHAMQLASRSDHLRRAVRGAVPFELRERIRSANLMTNEASADVRSLLAPRFQPDLARLADVLGRPTPSAWNR
jgi:hypothetical protein